MLAQWRQNSVWMENEKALLLMAMFPSFDFNPHVSSQFILRSCIFPESFAHRPVPLVHLWCTGGWVWCSIPQVKFSLQGLDEIWLMAGGCVFVLLFLYCMQGISKSFCLQFGWSPELRLRLLWLIYHFTWNQQLLADSLRWMGSPHKS